MSLRIKKLSEREFTDMVIKLARLRGWRVLHIRPGRTKNGWRTPVQGDGVGFPDLLLLRGIQILAIELKVGKGKVTEEQNAWLAAFNRVKFACARIYTPADWTEIEEVLE